MGGSEFALSYVGGDGNDVVLQPALAPTIEGVSFYNQDAALEAGLSVDSTGRRACVRQESRWIMFWRMLASRGSRVFAHF